MSGPTVLLLLALSSARVPTRNRRRNDIPDDNKSEMLCFPWALWLCCQSPQPTQPPSPGGTQFRPLCFFSPALEYQNHADLLSAANICCLKHPNIFTGGTCVTAARSRVTAAFERTAEGLPHQDIIRKNTSKTRQCSGVIRRTRVSKIL